MLRVPAVAGRSTRSVAGRHRRRENRCAGRAIVSPTFEWDMNKAQINILKHNVDFEEASTVLSDPLSITIDDERNTEGETRYIDIGMSAFGRILVVAYTERSSNIRIISCRKATNAERKAYEESTL